MLSNQILFFFSAIGVFNALLLCAYLFFGIKRKKTKHYLLAFLLLMLCIRIGVSCIYFFQKNLSLNWIQLGLTANFLIGPILYVYVRLLLSEREKLNKWEQIHLFGNTIFIVVFGLIYQFQHNYQYWDNVIRYYIHFQLTIYLILTTVRLMPVLKKWKIDQNDLNTYQQNVLTVYGLTSLICSGFVVSLYTSYVLGPVFTSLVFYGLIIGVILRQKFLKNLFFAPPKYANKKIESSEANDLLAQLKYLMEVEKLYKTPTLKLEFLAHKMNLTENRLSQLLNDNLGKNYAAYVNEFRVKAAQELLVTNELLTIEGIGYEVGFNSKTSFYTTFKKLTGLTPAAYKKQRSIG